MKNRTPGPSKKGFYKAIGGTLLVALCCFTPMLVIILGAVGLSTITPYLDYVLLPAMLAMIIVVIISYLRWKKASVRSRN
jgi:mercuric ion transport protein